MAGIYVHIPFCKQACHYCDFHFSTDLDGRAELCQALNREIELRKDYLTEKISTIYIGGGTPSLLNQREFEQLLTTIRATFSVSPDTEITLEANPDDLSFTKLKDLLSAGINRLSIGIQSFDDTVLRYLNRAHNSGIAYQCLEDVRTVGFKNVSIDLIYAIPGLSDQLWQQTLAEALKFSPEHISSYALTIEDRSVFGNWSKREKFTPIGDEKSAGQFEMLMATLQQAGYDHYEISNFSRPGFYSRHNSNYWKQADYLGIGPSAHSYQEDSRQFNVRNNAKYVRSINQGMIPFEREQLSRENKINEYILTTLRTSWGCDLNFLKSNLQDDLRLRSGAYLATLEQNGLLDITGEIIRLTQKGKLLADQIAEDLMVADA